MMMSPNAAAPAVSDSRRPLRHKAVADDAFQSQLSTETTDKPRRAFNDLTNRMRSQKNDLTAADQTLVSKPMQQKHNELRFSQALPNLESDCKDDDSVESIEHCFGNSEPAEWKGTLDVMDYLQGLQDPDLVSSDHEGVPLSNAPLVEIPHLPAGFFDDMPETFFDVSSDNELQADLPIIEATP